MPNLLTCAGFEGAQKASAVSFVAGECIKARLAIVFLFFIVAVLRKWGGEEIGINFSFLWGIILGIGGYIILISIIGSFKLAFALGVLLALAGGYGFGMFFGGEE